MHANPQHAGLFHAGNTCPFCQETVDEGQLIIACNACGSIHHETCWARKGKCSSYHCDDSANTGASGMHADIVIQKDELKNVQVPPPPVRRSPDAVARDYLPPKPERRSRLSLVGVIFGAVSFVGLWGMIAGATPLILLGICLCLAAMIFSVISLVIINANPRISGVRLAIAGTVFPGILMLACFGALYARHGNMGTRLRMDLKIQENLPKEEYLAKLQPSVAQAMRANVVIRFSKGLWSDGSYGSGVIVHYAGGHVHILTNKHVIGQGNSGDIQVTFFTGETSRAEVVWTAPGGMDVALIRCEALSLGDFNPVGVAEVSAAQGEKVFAIGNPMGLSWSYAEGTISALRTSNSGNLAVEVYQTQVPLNPGNSGGGLYSLNGVLLGLNTWTFDKSSGEGLGFVTASTGIVCLMNQGNVGHFLAVVREKQNSLKVEDEQ
jgi:S1-C subfamily serine protease